MRISTERILTTHVGSLPRSSLVTDVLFAHEAGPSEDSAHFDKVIDGAVADVVQRQISLGIDIVSESKISYATYIKDRLTGFEGDAPRDPPSDLQEYPNFMRRLVAAGGTPKYRRPRCVGPISVKTLAPSNADLSRLRASLNRSPANTEAFMNAASPGVIALFQPNEYYPSHERSRGAGSSHASRI